MPIYPSSTSLVPSIALYPSASSVPSGQTGSQITYVVKAVWPDVQATSIQFDVSLFGEGDKFADPLVADFTAVDGTVDTIGNIESIKIKRGRDDNLEAFGMGECVITIIDNTGRYNPANASGPLYNKLRPMRQVLVTAQLPDQAEVSLFRGYIRSIDHRAYANQKKTTITCGDLLLYLNKTKPVYSPVGRESTTGESISSILTAATFTYSSLRSIGQGDVIPSPGTSNTATGSSALSQISDLLEIERGDFYVAGNGVVTYSARSSRATKDTFATYKDISGYVIASTDLERVKNKATVTKDVADPGTDIVSTWADGNSVANYGQQDFSEIRSTYLYDAAQTLSLAQWLVAQRANPLATFRGIELTLNALDIPASQYALSTELSSRVFVENTAIGQTVKGYFVEAIEHTIQVGSHIINYTLLPIFAEVMVLDRTEAVLDSAVLTY